jgi:hypothetical protein
MAIRCGPERRQLFEKTTVRLPATGEWRLTVRA